MAAGHGLFPEGDIGGSWRGAEQPAIRNKSLANRVEKEPRLDHTQGRSGSALKVAGQLCVEVKDRDILFNVLPDQWCKMAPEAPTAQTSPALLPQISLRSELSLSPLAAQA